MVSADTIRLYVYTNTSWNYLQYSSGGVVTNSSTLAAAGSNTWIQFNSGGTTLGADTGFRIVTATSSINLRSDYKLIFDDQLGANTYFTYNSANQYLETFLDGEIRLQM